MLRCIHNSYGLLFLVAHRGLQWYLTCVSKSKFLDSIIDPTTRPVSRQWSTIGCSAVVVGSTFTLVSIRQRKGSPFNGLYASYHLKMSSVDSGLHLRLSFFILQFRADRPTPHTPTIDWCTSSFLLRTAWIAFHLVHHSPWNPARSEDEW